MAAVENKQDKFKALSITIVIHALLLITFIAVSFKIPPPPPNMDLGMEVNLGTSDDGMGEMQPLNPNPPAAAEEVAAAPPVATPAKADAPTESLATSDEEDAPVIHQPEKKTNVPKKFDKTLDKKEDKAKAKPTEKKEVPAPKKVEPKAKGLYTYKGGNSSGNSGNGAEGSNNSTGEGVTGKPGDQGKANGDPNAKGYEGNGGLGGGKSDFRLSGRKLLKAPSNVYNGPETGYVALNIKVDRNGNVVSAVPILSGTTITSQAAIEEARKSALQVKYDASPSAPAEQFGTVKVYFKTGG
ncbi:hypothetical protein COR50_15685 [Chitinophaga caeni]|uniref:Energy transducer TonB n=1 Tax=Chitinophaga caeni TaxID=2029983 RepID=A0A291QX91_9BACT|nr:hypothetical protein [Chitinophaga caeni]ATL48483.1 hypothetical protein COR50_15685 [Chitinophaga caeni]